MEEKYDLALEYFYFDLGKLKESQIYQIKACLGGSRIGSQMHFCSFGRAYFEPEDVKHSHLIVEPVENYDKSKVNCVIYNLDYNCQNMGYFDKLFIYLNQLKDTYYGYVLYNSETKHSCQKAMIDPQEDYLINNLTRDFLTMFKQDILEFYLKKYKAIKEFAHNKDAYVPSIEDYNEMMEKHREKEKI